MRCPIGPGRCAKSTNCAATCSTVATGRDGWWRAEALAIRDDVAFFRAVRGALAKRENVRARLRAMVRRILRRRGYPAEAQEEATRTIPQQAEMRSEVWLKAA